MKRSLSIVVLLVVLSLVAVVPAFAGPPEGAGHQRAAADLKGDVADLVPEHVAAADQAPAAHQAAAADLKGDVADIVPCHVAGVQCPD